MNKCNDSNISYYLYNAIKTGICAIAGKQPARGLTWVSWYNIATIWFCNSLLSGYFSLISAIFGWSDWVTNNNNDNSNNSNNSNNQQNLVMMIIVCMLMGK